MSEPRVFAPPKMPDDVNEVRDRHGKHWERRNGLWYWFGQYDYGQTGTTDGELLTWFGPLTEVPA